VKITIKPVPGANNVAHNIPSQLKPTRAQRIFKVRLFIILGKSNRTIARELGCDEGTIRNDRKLIALPDEKVRQAMAGAPVARLMREHKAVEAAQIRKRQEQAEKKAYFLTNKLAKAIDEWIKRFPLLPVNRLRVIRAVDPLCWFHRAHSNTVHDSAIKAVIASTRPTAQEPSDDFALIEWLVAWLYAWITRVEPYRDVRDRALAKVRLALEQECPGW
jgi:hypothetical protein